MVPFLIIVLSGAAFALGIWLVLRRRPEWRWVLPLSALPLAFRMALIYIPGLDIALFPFDWYPAVESWWFFPFPVVLMGAAAAYVESMLLRDGLLVLEGLVFVYFVLIGWGESFTDFEALTGEPDEDGHCEQTTLISCGAAAGSTFVASYGQTVTEREMAEVSNTTHDNGTTVCGMVCGLSKKLPGGREVLQVGTPDLDEIDALARPVLTVIRLGIVQHWVVIEEVGTTKLLLWDPSRGTRRESRARFEASWKGPSVWSEPAATVMR